MSLEELFYKSESTGEKIEGYLGNKEPKANVLFILKEPHSKKQDEFWFYNVVNNNEGYRAGNGKRYYTILGSLAYFLTGKESKDEALKQCAYINLFPYYGGSNTNEKMGYLNTKNTINKLLKAQDQNEEKQTEDPFYKIAQQRIKLIKKSNENGIEYIVTVPDFYNVLKSAYSRRDSEDIYLSLEFIRKGTTSTRYFCMCELENGTKLLEFWHPSYTRINYDFLKKVISNGFKKQI